MGVVDRFNFFGLRDCLIFGWGRDTSFLGIGGLSPPFFFWPSPVLFLLFFVLSRMFCPGRCFSFLIVFLFLRGVQLVLFFCRSTGPPPSFFWNLWPGFRSWPQGIFPSVAAILVRDPQFPFLLPADHSSFQNFYLIPRAFTLLARTPFSSPKFPSCPLEWNSLLFPP